MGAFCSYPHHKDKTRKPKSQSLIVEVEQQQWNIVQQLLIQYNRNINNIDKLERIGPLITRLRNLQVNPFPTEPSREDAISDFVDWCTKRNIQCNGVQIKPIPGRGLAIVAERSLTFKEEIIRVPFEAMLSSKASKDECAHLLPSTIDKSWLQIPIAMKLICDRLSRTPEWVPYLAVLPKQYEHPNCMTAEELKYLKGSVAYQESVDLWVEMINQYCLIFNHIKEITKTQQLSITLSTFTYDVYIWAITTSLTRSLRINSEKDPLTAMVPLWDMLNQGVETVTTALSQRLTASAAKAHEPGEELNISYRDSTTAEFFTVWGLVTPNKCYSPLKVALTSEFAHFKSKKATLLKLGFKPTADFKIFTDLAMPLQWIDVTYLMVMFLGEEDLNWPFSGRLCSSTWSKAWQALAGRLAYTLHQYPRTVAYCQALLLSSEVKLQPGAKLALRQVIAEQEILETARQRSIVLSKQLPPTLLPLKTDKVPVIPLEQPTRVSVQS